METQIKNVDLTLRELTEFVKEKGGHFEGRGDGTVRWVYNDVNDL